MMLNLNNKVVVLMEELDFRFRFEIIKKQWNSNNFINSKKKKKTRKKIKSYKKEIFVF